MIGVDLTQVRQLCEAGDGPGAAHQLRWGTTSGGLSCAPAPIVELNHFEWREVHRLPLPRPSYTAAAEAALTGLWGSSTALAVLVSAEEGESPRLHLGTRGEGLGSSWVQAMLGPGAQLGDPEAGPPSGIRRLAVAPPAMQRALSLGLTPATARPDAPLQGEQPDDVPLIGRLLALPVAPFAALLLCLPVGALQLEAVRVDAEQALDAARRRSSVSVQTTEASSLTETDPAMARAADHLDLLLAQLRLARAAGGWIADMVLTAGSDAAMAALVGAAVAGLPPPASLAAERVVDELVIDPNAAVGGSFLCSEELVPAITPPESGTGSLEVLAPPPASTWKLSTARPLHLGTSSGSSSPFAVDLDDLAGHVFVTGITGSGKSTTLWRLLTQLWNVHRVPFLLVDPVKSEHEALGGILRDGLSVVRAGDLRMNVLAPYPGFDPSVHLGLVSTVFRGCFSLPTPVPYMVRLLFDRLADRPGCTTLHDVRAELGPLADELGYAGEVDSNIRAALGSRLAVLTSPREAIRLCAPDSSQVAAMLERPTLVELSDVGDDDERAFLMAMLTVYVMEASRGRPAGGGPSHVTVLEEAHRVLPEPRPVTGDGAVEGGDAASAVSKLLTQMLAEARGFGESVIVADQSPAAVAREVIRNTALKVAHRTVDPADREVVGGALGLDRERSEPLAYLDPGEAVVAGRRIRAPQTVRMTLTHPGAGPPLGAPPAGGGWPCCEGDRAHHVIEAAGDEAELAVSLWCAASVGSEPGADPVEQLRRRLGHPHARCIVQVGLRRYLRRLVSLGQLPAAGYDVALDRLFAAYTAGQGREEVAAVLQEAFAADPPYTGCRDCRSRCSLRAVSAGAAGAQMRHLQSLLARAHPNQEPDVATAWAKGVRSMFSSQLPGRSEYLALCLLLRVLVSTGRGDDSARLLKQTE